MAIALTHKNTMIHTDGNKKSACYTATFSGTYPAGGYTVNNAAFPSALNVFKKILRVLFNLGQFNEDGDMFLASDIVNTDPTNPTFRLRLFQFPTGGGAPIEAGTGIAFAGSTEVIIEGIAAGGVDSDTV